MENKRTKISMQDIADELGISKNAVSMAYSGKRGISEALRNTIFETGNRLGYVKPQPASQVQPNRYILFLVDEQVPFSDAYYFRIYSEVMRYSQELNYQTMITSISRKMQENNELPEIIHDPKVCGVLATGLFEASYLQMIMSNGTPLVVLVNQLMNVHTDFVMSDNVQGAYQIVRHLISLGHRKIGFFSPIYSYHTFLERWQGYQLALHSYGIEPLSEYSFVSEINYGSMPHEGDHNPPSEKEISTMVDRIQALSDPPTAWFCGQDPLAYLLINEFMKRGLRIPEDISVAGYDNSVPAPPTLPMVTTLDDQREVMARHAVDRLLSHMEDPVHWHPVTIRVTGKLIPGDTTKELLSVSEAEYQSQLSE